MAATKLTYLSYRGRAEVVRFLLAYKSIIFEDVRLKPEEWAEKMPGIEFGKVVFEQEGTVLQGNETVIKSLADKYEERDQRVISVKYADAQWQSGASLAGNNETENRDAFHIVSTTEEIWNKMSKMFWEKDQEKKEAARKELLTSYLPATLKGLEVKIVKNGGPWMVGQTMTCADLCIAVLLQALSDYKPELLAVFPTMAKVKTEVEESPNIKKWMAVRPASKN